MSIYRLYIDESGDHNYSNDDTFKSRYLCLTGVIMSKETIDELRFKIRELQDLVGDDPEDTKFHGEDIKAGKGIFGLLHTDTGIRAKWNEILFSMIDTLDFSICGIVLDKKEHKEKYGNAALHPYHYCLNLLIEKYLRFLEEGKYNGDIMAESRGKKEDRLLGDAFSSFYTQGNQFYSPDRIQQSITSKDIKIKTKSHAIPGLLWADILALAVKFDVLLEYERVDGGMKDNFVGQLSQKIQKKYLCSSNGVSKECGKKLV